jgi:hypothetical protein
MFKISCDAGEMGGYVVSALACYGNTLSSNRGISQPKMGDTSKRVANTFYPAKKLLHFDSVLMF